MTIFSSKRAFFAALLLFGLLAMTARNAIDPDLWWHLRTGKLMIDTGRVPHTDPFSFTRAGSPWVSHEWLSEVIFYWLWKIGGPAALIVFSSIITTGGFLLLYLRCPGKPHWAAAATVVGALAAAPCWGTRPQMFTFALSSLLLWLIDRSESRPRLLFWIPPLFLLWLNLHAGFALGPALMLLYAAGLALEAVTGSTPWSQARPIILRVLLATSACIAIVPLNPSGTQLYRYPIDTLRSHGMRSFIVEWFSPDFHQWLYTPFLLVLLLLVIVLALSNSRPRGRILLPLLFTTFAALDAIRHIPIFILLAMPVISAALPGLASGFPAPQGTRSPGTSHRPFFSAAAIILLAGFTFMRWITLSRNQTNREADWFPQQAVAFLRSNDEPGRLFAYYDWGGYSIWNLYPRYRVFVDGRADLYGDELLHQFQAAAELQKHGERVLDDWNVQTLLMPPSSALSQALFLNPHWSVRYQDTQAVVFVRTEALPGADTSLAPTILKTQFH